MAELEYFFSYARKDSVFVLRLAKELREAGINLWLDQLDIVGGQLWDTAIDEALHACQGVIAVLSPEAVGSKNVMDEVSYALEEGKIVIPVLLHSCTIPYRLRRVQYIDFTADYNTGFSRLLRALQEPSGHRPPPVPPNDNGAPRAFVWFLLIVIAIFSGYFLIDYLLKRQSITQPPPVIYPQKLPPGAVVMPCDCGVPIPTNFTVQAPDCASGWAITQFCPGLGVCPSGQPPYKGICR
jgi:hypothetical protein